MYFTSTPDIKIVIPDLEIHCSKLRDRQQYLNNMNREWTRLALTDAGCMSGLFLSACRHLSRQHPARAVFYQQLAERYKLACLQRLVQALSDEMASVISEATVAKATMLAYDEVSQLLFSIGTCT